MVRRATSHGAAPGAGCAAAGTAAIGATGSTDVNADTHVKPDVDAAPPASASDADSLAPTRGTRPSSPTADRAGPGTVARIRSEQLFRGAVELQIEHRGGLYRLKQTALGKLILTK